MSHKRYERKEADDLKGGEYEAAVNKEKEDDRRSHRELVGGTPPQQLGSDQEEVSVAALNVRNLYSIEGKESTYFWTLMICRWDSLPCIPHAQLSVLTFF